MAETLGIQVRIETQADVAAVTKTTEELGKLSRSGDELDSSMARLKAKLNEAEAAIKGTGDAATPAGDAMGAGMAGGAARLVPVMAAVAGAVGVAKVAFGEWLEENEKVGQSMGNLKDAVSGAMSGMVTAVLGDGSKISDFLDELTRAFGGQTEETRKWAHTAEEMARLQADAVSAATKKTIADLDAQSRAYERAVDAIRQHAKAVQENIEDEQHRADLQTAEDKAAIDADGDLSPEEKSAAKKEIDDRARADRQARDEQISAEKKNAAQAETDAAAERLKQVQAQENANLEKIRKLNAADDAATGARAAEEESKAIGTPQEFLPGTPMVDPEYESKLRQKAAADARARRFREDADRLRKEAGGGSVEEAEGVAKNLRKTVEGAADDLDDAAKKERDVTGAEDRKSLKREAEENSRRRTEELKGERGGDSKADKKEAADAGKAAKEAAKSVDSGTKDMAAGLKTLADMVKGKDAKMADAFTKMAEGLKDGASEAELAKIQSAMDVVARSQNEAFATLGKTVDSMANAVESSSKLAQEALQKAKALENKVNAMR